MTPLDDGIWRRFERLGKLEDGFDDFPLYFPFFQSGFPDLGLQDGSKKDSDAQATATQKTFIGVTVLVTLQVTTSLRTGEISLYSWGRKV